MDRKKLITASAVVFLVGSLVRLPLILFIPKDGLYNTDELSLALSVLDHWMGLPATQLMWPATPFQVVGVLALAPKFVLQLVSDRSLEQFSQILIAFYQDPSSVIVMFRIISVFAAAGFAVVIFQIVQHITSNIIVSALAAVAVSAVPEFLQLSVTARPDAVTLLCFALCAKWLVCSPGRPVLAAVAAAAVVILKYVFALWLLPILCAGFAFYVYENRNSDHLLKTTMQSVGVGLVSALLLFPYIWVDPLRAIKTLVGNSTATNAMGASGIPSAWLFSIEMPGEFILVLMLAISVAGGITAFRHQRWRWLGVGLALTTFGMTTFIWLAHFAYWRYLLGAIVPIIILIAIVSVGRGRVFVILSLAIGSAALSAESIYEEWQTHTGSGLRALLQAVNEKCKLGEDIWLEDDILLWRYDSMPLTHESIISIVKFMESPDRTRELISTLGGKGISVAAATALQTAFSEHEQVYLARWRAMALLGEAKSPCHMELFNRHVPGEIVSYRGSFTDKTAADAASYVASHNGNKPVNVVGDTTVLDRNGIPISQKFGTWGISIAPRQENSKN